MAKAKGAEKSQAARRLGGRSRGGAKPRPQVNRPNLATQSNQGMEERPQAEMLDEGEAKFSIVGVGASAGGLEAFTQLLNALPADSGMAIVLVQHLSPTHQSVLPELLAGSTSLPVEQVSEGTEIKPNHIY